MYRKTHINITLDSQLLNWIDSLRGQEPRSTFINLILSKFYAKTKGLFDWEMESKESEEDIRQGHIHRFSDPQKAIEWLKS